MISATQNALESILQGIQLIAGHFALKLIEIMATKNCCAK